jgi:hypothetical protein
MRSLVGLVLLAIAAESHAQARQTSVQLFSVDRSAQLRCEKGTLRAVPRCSGNACGDPTPLTAEWSFKAGSAESQLALRPDVSWEIAIEGKNCWAAPLIVAAGNNGETRTAFVWPAAAIAGVFPAKKGESPPNALHATVESGETDVPSASITQTSLECFVEGLRWRCALPSTTVDVRLEADGYAPQYLWGVKVPAGEKKGIDLVLSRGASISGRVALGDRRAQLDAVAVELRPAGLAATPADERRLGAQARITGTSARGFFQLSHVDGGTYDLVVTKKGWSTVTKRVRIGAGKETDAGVLTLPPLTRAEVIIDPAVDAKGRRWRVVLDRDPAPLQPLPPIADKQAAADGTWSAPGLMAGRYRLDVYDGGGVAYERLTVGIQPGDPPIRFHMDALMVRGVVRVGKEPLPAALRFINTQAPGDLDLVTDDRGAFAGTFPAAGRYSVEIFPKESAQKLRRLVDVQPDSEGIVNLDIDLPGGVIHGNVVDEAGNPVAATVQILPGGSRRPMLTAAGEDGTFRLIGVDSGDVVLNARDRDAGESGPIPHTVREGESEPVTLTLHPRIEFTVWLVSSGAQPVAGALVRFSDGHYSREQISGPGGDVRFAIARGINAIDLIVMAAGFPIRMMNLPISADMDLNPRVMLGRTSALLVARSSAPPWPALRPLRGSIGLHFLWELFSAPMGGGASSNRTARGYEFELDPGDYVLCPDSNAPAKCVQRTLSPGTETIIDFPSLRTEEPAK